MLAEACLQLQRHEQFTELAAKGLPLAHLLRIQAAGKLLGEGAAPLQHPPTHQVGDQGAGRADRIDAGMPPEAAVLTREEGIDEHRGVVRQPAQLPVAMILGRGNRAAGAVIKQKGTPHGSQLSADRLQQCSQGQAHGPEPRGCCEDHRQSPQHAQTMVGHTASEADLRQLTLVLRPEAHGVPIGEQQATDPASAPPEPIGGVLVLQKPAPAPLLEQGMPTAHRPMLQGHLGAGVPADPITPGMQHDTAKRLARLEDLQHGSAGWASGRRGITALSRGDGDAAARHREGNRPRRR